jgi:sulfate/thiosulfate transport system substrate-binding protein
MRTTLLLTAALLGLAGCRKDGAAKPTETVTLLNVSYDPTRELYEEVNAAFARAWLQKTGQAVTVNQSHGGSGKQARAVIDGLEADVVTLALAYDVDALATKGRLLPADWAKRLPHNSAPYTSTVVFVVHQGNPKGIRDWDDLAKPGVEVITANPKTSGGARWNYLAAYGVAARREGGGEQKAQELIRGLFANVPVLDTGARGATPTIAPRGNGDVLVAWENEALLLLNGPGKDKLELVVPPSSILAEPPVAVVDTYVDKHKTRDVAEAYVQFLYSDEGQAIVAKHHFRPAASDRYAGRFPKLSLFTVDEAFGGWSKAQATHFAEGGLFDQLYRPQGVGAGAAR